MRNSDDSGWWNPRVLAILAIVFFCGTAFGAAAMRVYLHRVMVSPNGPQLVYNGHRVFLSQLDKELNLRPEQKLQIELILDDFAKYYQNLEEQRQEVAEHGKQKIMELLDDPQRARFEQLLHTPPRR
jgi:hypothetical protein